MAKIAFTLVSPLKQLFGAEADMVLIPAESGDMGVMAGHSPVIGTVRAGTIIVHDGSSDTRLFIEGGFLEVNGEKVIVLTENGSLVKDLDKKDAQQQLSDAEKEVAYAQSADKALAMTALLIAKARVDAIESPVYS